MSILEEITARIQQLEPDQFQALQAWLDEYETQLWDAQFDEDVRAGRLEDVRQRVLADIRQGRYTDL